MTRGRSACELDVHAALTYYL
eukprot:COSAG01_NODE_21980_length_877_cov_1.061697_2_plen_20_part_01